MIISTLINLYYDYFYVTNSNCYETKETELDDIQNVDNIKQMLSKKDSYEFINNLLTSQLIYLNTLLVNFGNKYIFKLVYDNNPVTLTIFVYNNFDDENNLNKSENINKVFLKLFSNFLLSKKSRHILLQLINIDILIAALGDLLPVLNIESLNELYNQNTNQSDKHSQIVSFNITEHYNKLSFLNNFLDEKLLKNWTDKEYTTLIFQILHTLAIIQTVYPLFRHNNLDINYIEGYIIPINGEIYPYFLNDNIYHIHNNGYIYKMNNFESSVIPKIIDNLDITEDLKTHNSLYDINMFLESLEKYINNMNITIPPQTKKFIKKCTKIGNEKYDISLLLQDNYFNKSNTSEKTISNDTNMTTTDTFLFRGTRTLPSSNISLRNNHTNQDKQRYRSSKSSEKQNLFDTNEHQTRYIKPSTNHPFSQPQPQMPGFAGIPANSLHHTQQDMHTIPPHLMQPIDPTLQHNAMQAQTNMPQYQPNYMQPQMDLGSMQPNYMQPQMDVGSMQHNYMQPQPEQNNMSSYMMQPQMDMQNMMYTNMVPNNMMYGMQPPSMVPNNMMYGMQPPNMMYGMGEKKEVVQENKNIQDGGNKTSSIIDNLNNTEDFFFILNKKINKGDRN